MKKEFLSFIFLILLCNVSFSLTSWEKITYRCNNYEYFGLKSPPTCGGLGCLYTGYYYYGNHSRIASSYSGSSSWGYTQNITINNVRGVSTQKCYYSSCSVDTVTLPASVCPGNICKFYVCFDDQSPPDLMNDSIMPCGLIEVELYQGCETPSLIINSSIIGANAYYFSFNITNSIGWGGISCLFTMKNYVDNLNIFSYNFSETTTTPIVVPFNSLGGRGIYSGNVKCYYNNQNNISTLFADQTWLIDTNVIYKIADINRNIGNVTFNPYPLYAHLNLTSIMFRVITTTDKVDYGKEVKVYLNTTQNTNNLGCFGSINTTTNLNGPIYVIPLGFSCANQTSFLANLSVYSADGSELLDKLQFPITFKQGEMIIDNVNLIKNPRTNNSEFWVTVSTPYTKSPIPDTAELSCSFWLKSVSSGAEFSGPLLTYRTYSEGLVELMQTDAYNKTFDNDTSYDVGSKFQYQVNCSARNFSSASISGYTEKGYFRIKSFVCRAMQTYYKSKTYLTYSTDKYITDATLFYCYVKPDIEITDQTTSQEAVLIATFYAELGANHYIIRINPYLSKYPMQPTCQATQNADQQWDKSTKQFIVIGMPRFQEADATCMITPLSSKKYYITTYFENWYYNSSSIVPNTFTTLAVDMEYIQPYENVSVLLNIIDNKTKNIGVAEQNNTLLCTTNIYDPSNIVARVEHLLVDSENTEICSRPEVFSNPTNSTLTEYKSIIPLTTKNCPRFATFDLSGNLTCVSKVFTYGGDRKEYRSNSLPYATPLSYQPPPRIVEDIANIVFKNWFMDTLLTILFADPLRFILGALLFLICAILFIPTILKLIVEAIIRVLLPEKKEGGK